MFLRSKMRFKDGKQHRYWSIVANRRVADGRVVQRQGLSLGERNASQTAAWCQAIEVLDEDAGASAQLDLTSTYFESAPPGHGKHGYRRDRRPDCGPVVIARIGTPDGFPLAYEVLPGKTGDKSTVEDFLVKIEEQYGQAGRIWIMDRGLPTGDSLATRRAAETAVRYLVGTPKGRLSKFEKAFLTKPWAQVRARVDGRLLAQDGEVSIHQRDDRIEAPICVAFLAYCLQVPANNACAPWRRD